MIDQYFMIKEHLRWALALPPYINLIFIPLEISNFLLNYGLIREKHSDGSFWDLLDMYLSRNSSDFLRQNVEETAEDNFDRLRLKAFMERAKTSYLEEGGELSCWAISSL